LKFCPSLELNSLTFGSPVVLSKELEDKRLLMSQKEPDSPFEDIFNFDFSDNDLPNLTICSPKEKASIAHTKRFLFPLDFVLFF
jgi:hypothetical protein